MPEGLGHIQISKFNAEEVAGRAALPPSRGRALQLRTGQQFPWHLGAAQPPSGLSFALT